MSRILRYCCYFIAMMLVYWSLVAAQSVPSSNNCVDIKQRMDRAEAMLKDWPDLGRYREANGMLSSPTRNESRVVFLGDSITDMWDDPGSGGFFPGKPYVNRGISGQATPQMLIRFHADVVELQPKVVVILAGTNDIAGNTGPTTLEAIENNLASMWEMAEEHALSLVRFSQ